MGENRANKKGCLWHSTHEISVDKYLTTLVAFRSLLPCWEEVLLFNEIFSYLLSREESDPKVILFFEVRSCLHKDAIMPQIRIITLQGSSDDIPNPKP